MLRRLNDALPDLVLGIIVYGVLAELIGVWFVTDKVRYSTGLLIGISLAVGMAIHIAVVIRDAVEIYGEHGARNRVIAKSLLRYVVVVIVFFAMMKFNLGNLFSAFMIFSSTSSLLEIVSPNAISSSSFIDIKTLNVSSKKLNNFDKLIESESLSM